MKILMLLTAVALFLLVYWWQRRASTRRIMAVYGRAMQQPPLLPSFLDQEAPYDSVAWDREITEMLATTARWIEWEQQHRLSRAGRSD